MVLDYRLGRLITQLGVAVVDQIAGPGQQIKAQEE